MFNLQRFIWSLAIATICSLGLVYIASAQDTTAAITTPAPTTGTVLRNANLRGGPGTTYNIVGSAKAGATLQIVGANTAGDWYQLDAGAWIAAFLVSTQADPPTGTIAPTATITAAGVATSTVVSPTARQAANLRGGPGTTYPIIGRVQAGQALTVTERNEAGDWLQLDDGAWIAAFLVNGAPAVNTLAAETSSGSPAAPATEATPAPTVAPTATPEETTPATEASSSIVGIGQELQGNGWRFKVIEVHKRKAVYWRNDAYVAMGNFLVVIIEAVNEQGGTDFFERRIDPYLTDGPGNVYGQSSRGTLNATWQYGGIGTIYTDVNPGNLVRMAMVFDLQDGVGQVLLSTDLPAWVDLGDFDSMKVEDQ